jgi:hypothetical protein
MRQPGARVLIFAFLLLLVCIVPLTGLFRGLGLSGRRSFESFAVAQANEAQNAVRASNESAMSRLARVDAARVNGVGVVLTQPPVWRP